VAVNRTVPEAASTAATTETSLQAAAENGATGTGAVDEERNLFVGMEGMWKLPGLPEVGGGYGLGSGKNGTGVFTALTGPLGGTWGGAGSNTPPHRVGGAGGVAFWRVRLRIFLTKLAYLKN
jgi:hypothetical protein